MKKILIILLALCLFIPVVLGLGHEGNSDPGEDLEKVPGDAITKTTGVEGVRISLVNSNGQNLASKDYILDDKFNLASSNGWKINVSSSSCSRIGYNSGTCFYSNGWVSKNVGDFAERLSTFSNFFTKYNFSLNIANAVTSRNYEQEFEKLISSGSNLTESVHEKNGKALFNDILRDFGLTTLDDYKIAGTENEYDLFLVYEHTIVVMINQEYYYGTTYELANKSRTLEACGTKLSNCPPGGNGLGALWDVYDLVTSQMACSSYLDGKFYNNISSKSYSVFAGKFTPSSYFNGSIIIDSYYQNRCNAQLSVNPGTANFDKLGIGIGFLWIGDFFNGTYTPEPPTPEKGTYNCTPLYNVGTCIDNEQVQYVDSAQGAIIDDDYWSNCVFNNGKEKPYYTIQPHKDSNVNQTDLTYYESGLGGKYCEVYCIENFTSTFPEGGITVLAGQYFVWGNGEATGGRTCRTKEVDWDQFEKDMNTANKNIRQSYVDWQLELLKAKAIEEAENSPIYDSSKCDYVYNDKGVEACEHAVWSNCATGSERQEKVCGPNDKPNANGKCYENTCQGGYVCAVPNTERYIRYEPKSQRFSITNGESAYWNGPNDGGWCSNQSKTTANPAAAENRYLTAIETAKGVIKEMKQCYNWTNSDKIGNIYTTNPTFTVNYSDTKYNYSGQLNTSINYNDVSDTSSKIIEEEVPRVYECNGNECYYFDEPMKNGGQGYFEMTRTANIYFSLQDNIFRYVMKNNNKSENTIQSNSPFSSNYYDIGFSNFPVAFSTPDGTYNTLNIHYENLGHTKGAGTTDVDTILSAIDNANYKNWSCEFNVYSKLVPDPNNPNKPSGPGDVNVVFRTIDLINPFPDIDGNNRNTGSNWCSYYNECAYNNNVVKEFITNNRDVSDYEIYSGEPMYTFVLTPSIIKEIRRYNSANSYSEYTGSLDGKNYDYKCNSGSETGKYCISDYLSYIINITDAKNQPGTCVDDKYRNYNDTGNFDSCRY